MGQTNRSNGQALNRVAKEELLQLFNLGNKVNESLAICVCIYLFKNIKTMWQAFQFQENETIFTFYLDDNGKMDK